MEIIASFLQLRQVIIAITINTTITLFRTDKIRTVIGINKVLAVFLSTMTINDRKRLGQKNKSNETPFNKHMKLAN